MALNAATLYDHHQGCGIQAAAVKYLGPMKRRGRSLLEHGG
jgi:hypothetical protein